MNSIKSNQRKLVALVIVALAASKDFMVADGWMVPNYVTRYARSTLISYEYGQIAVLPASRSFIRMDINPLCMSSQTEQSHSRMDSVAEPSVTAEPESPFDYQIPEDAVIQIKPLAMKRLRELRQQQMPAASADPLVLRMGVRSGGCSGMSYVMDFSAQDAIQEDDAVDIYEQDKIWCVVDAKSLLYLYGLELDYSPKLIGGGFQFFNPNAEASCGCGSSFGV